MTAVAPLPTNVQAFVQSDERLQPCPADPDYARRMLDDIIEQECEDVLHAASQGRWRKANTYSYDGARKAVEAWLLADGWRVRGAPGAHAAVGEIVSLWLERWPDPGPRIASMFGASTRGNRLVASVA